MSKKIEIKKEKLIARGIRFSDSSWKKISDDATRDKSGNTTPSDVVRWIVDQHYEGKKK